MTRRRTLDEAPPPIEDSGEARQAERRFVPRRAGEILGDVFRQRQGQQAGLSTRQVVNGLSRQELILGIAATVIALGLSLELYFQYRGYPGSTAKDIATRHDATTVLAAGLVATAILALGTALRRRALLGFAALVSGFALGTVGIVYIAFGGWLIFRVLKKQKADRLATGEPAGRRSRSSRPASGRRGGATSTAKAPPKPPPSKRYTPPRAARGSSAGARKR